MPRNKSGWSTSSKSSLGIRLTAAVTVVALHAIVAAGMLSTEEVKPVLPESQPIMVSVVEAPVPQVAKAPETEQPPQPAVQPPPPQPEPEPEVKPEPEPDPAPPEKIEPTPEPEPVVEKPPVPAPQPKPKPKPKPRPPVQQAPAPKPVEQPPTPAPPAGAPDGATMTQAPRQGPPRDQPETVSNIEYLGAGPAPVYPAASKRRREEGRVMVLVVVNPQGLVEKATVVSSSGYPRLDEAALDALRRVRFKPYTRNGVAYTVQARIPFDFNIRN
ncbi:energy transducer TonB [Bordetella flabilis]|uniref:Energy transducer TonB n=1 Tax=Bordetella flabilis TaxID=463014 RepID=A0A193GLC9_9BORD|nr:energy transducer TonB [Bordetella flabilis]ANN80373.1 energy transducer TonB [Bordetella flabilis]